MRVGFFTPTFHTLAPTWRRDPQIVKLAAPTICGALAANGFEDLRQYDFEVEVFDLEREQPGRLNLRVFFDDANVEAFLRDDHPEIRAQVELLLHVLEVEEADLFAFSCASVLEIYADMHAVANLNLCFTKALKQRWPKCRTMIGGLKISPDSKHKAEYVSMLERCPTLDFAVENRGEAPILNVVDHLASGASFESLGQTYERYGSGLYLRSGSDREMRLSPSLARAEGIEVARGYTKVGLDSALVNGAVPLDTNPLAEAPKALVSLHSIPAKVGAPVGLRVAPASAAHPLPISPVSDAPQAAAQAPETIEEPATPEVGFGPQGEHERKPIFNPSVMLTPWFDPRNIERRKITGQQLADRYHLGPEWQARLAPHMGDRIAILPGIFMEGCNARCAFCAYSMTKMVTRDVKEVVRALAHLREKHDVKYFHFLNTNINGSMKYAEAFVDELIAAKLELYWSDCANLWALNPRLLEKMVKSGCIRFTFGLECPSDRMLDYIGKGITVRQAHERLKLASDMGIWNHLLLITGLPTETDEDQKHFVDFLEESKDYSNAYSISAFYLIGSSLMGAFPHRYGIEMMPNPSGLLEDQGFNETGGLTWERKKRQIIRSTELITDTIKRLKIDPKYWSGAIDLELLFWLYECFGHASKADVVRCYEDAFLGAPAHPKAYLPGARAALESSPALAEQLTRGGLRALPEQLEVRSESVILPVESTQGGGKVELELRCLTHGLKPSLVSGENVGASAAVETPFAEPLAALLSEGSELDRSITKAGWTVLDRSISKGVGSLGIRLELGGRAVDLYVHSVAPGARVFLSRGTLGVSYSVPAGFTDPTKDPRVIAFLQQLGKVLLERLAADPRAAAAAWVNLDAVREFAAALITELEAPFLADIRLEPLHKHANVGKRHRDQYSKVTANG
jgi:radical SAM superfamily enzyme YgiQ (UPF0313 family)